MRHHEQCSLISHKIILKPLRHPSVKMVGRLVKYQNIRPGKKCSCKRNSLPLTARQLVNHCIILGKTKLSKYRLCLSLYHPFIPVCSVRLDDILIYRTSFSELRILRKIPYMHIASLHNTSLIGSIQSRRNL